MKKDQDQRTEKIMATTKIYHDFPKPGLRFLDIFPIIANPQILAHVVDIFAEDLSKVNYDHIFMLESRGFVFAVPLSQKVKKPCHPFRKKGKLPGEVAKLQYNLEYGSDAIEMQKNLIKEGDKVVIVDDVLATGGTMNAAIKLIQQEGGVVERVVLLNVVSQLNGIEKLLVPKEKVFYIFDI